MTPATHKDFGTVVKGASAALAGFLVRVGGRIFFLIAAGRLFGGEALGVLATMAAVVETLAAIAVFGQKRTLFPLLEAQRDNQAAFARIAATALAIPAGLGLAFTFFLVTVGWAILGLNSSNTALFFAAIVPVIALTDVMLALTRFGKRVRYEVWSRSIAEPWTLFALTLGLGISGLSADGLLFAYMGALLAALSVAILGFHREFGELSFEGAWPKAAVAAQILRVSAPTAAVDVVTLAFRRVDLFLVFSLAGGAAAGIYYAAQQVASLVQKIRHIFEPILAPVVAGALADDKARANRLLSSTSRWSLILAAPMMAIIITFAEPILNLIEPGMAIGSGVLILLIFAESFEAIFAPAESLLVFKNAQTNLALNLTAFTILIAGCLWLVPDYGGLGAGMAFLASLLLLNVSRAGVVAVLHQARLLGPAHLKPALAAAGAYTVGYMLPLDKSSGLGAIMIGVAVLVVYGILLWAFRIDDEDKSLWSGRHRLTSDPVD